MMDIPKHDDEKRGKKSDSGLVLRVYMRSAPAYNIQGSSIRQCACAARHDKPTYTYACVFHHHDNHPQPPDFLQTIISCIFDAGCCFLYTTWLPWFGAFWIIVRCTNKYSCKKWQIKRGEIKVCFSLFVKKVDLQHVCITQQHKMQDLMPPPSFIAAYT